VDDIKACKRSVADSCQTDIFSPSAQQISMDLFDRLLSSYRPTIRGKKWLWPLFVHAINVTVVAAWRVHCRLANSKDYPTFCREIARTLLKMTPDNVKTVMSSDLRSNPPAAVRYDGVDHIVGKVTQGRCQVYCKNTPLSCVRCEVRLHRERGAACWDLYHSNSKNISQP